MSLLHVSRLWVSALMSVMVVGCAVVGPDYVKPELPATEVPAQWSSPIRSSERGEGAQQTVIPWWAELADPVLDRLVETSLGNSPTVEAALARLTQARWQAGQMDALGKPVVTGTADVTASNRPGASTVGWFSASSSWEIDLFGAVRRGREAASARAEAQSASLADVRVSLIADVTDAYLSHRACQSNLALNEQDLASRQATEALTSKSVEVGFTAPYLGIRSQASVAEARTQLAARRAECEQLENLLTRLVGIARPELMRVLAERPTGLARLPVPQHFSLAIPATALLARPDMRAAERLLAASSAEIGFAEADRYPRLSLNGALAYTAGRDGAGALSLGSWSVGPSLSIPLFDSGVRSARVEVARARYAEQLAQYKATARRAIQEVEDGLTRYAAAHERAESALQSARQYEDFFAAVEVRFREGASNLLELEDARRAMLAAQRTLLAVHQERLQAWVALHRATGGAARLSQASSASTGQSRDVTTYPVDL